MISRIYYHVSCVSVNQLRDADNDGDLSTSLAYSYSERDYYIIVSVALDSTIRVWCLWSGMLITRLSESTVTFAIQHTLCNQLR